MNRISRAYDGFGAWIAGAEHATRSLSLLRIVYALAMLALGSLLRLGAGTGWMLLVTAALCGLGAAIVQAVFPGIIKQHFPRHVAVVTGLYSSMLMGGGALGAQAAPLIARASGNWRLALAALALPAILAAAMAARLLPRNETASSPQRATPALIGLPRTWLLMACFGLVNGGYASVVAWLALSYQERGWSGAASGGLLAIVAASQAIAALLLPMLAGRRPDRRHWLWLTLAMQAAGFAAHHLMDIVDRALDLAEDRIGVRAKRLADRRQGYAALRPLEKLGTEFAFQRLDGERERRLGDVEAFGGAPEMEFFTKHAEIAQLADVH